MAIKVGVIGLGYWGPNLVRNFCTLPESELVTGCDLQADRCEKIAALYPSIRCTQNVDEVFQHHEIDAIAIATPVHTHYELAKTALAAGQTCSDHKALNRQCGPCRRTHQFGR